MQSAHARILAHLEATSDEPLAELPTDWPIEVWEVLVAEFPDLHYWAAHSRHVPEEILRRLVAAGSWRVRARVAQKRRLPADLFDLLAADPHDAVRQRLAANAKAPLAIVEQLTHDRAEHVAHVARIHLEARRAAGAT